MAASARYRSRFCIVAFPYFMFRIVLGIYSQPHSPDAVRTVTIS